MSHVLVACSTADFAHLSNMISKIPSSYKSPGQLRIYLQGGTGEP